MLRREREPFLLSINPGLCYHANLAEKITGRPIVSGNNCPTAKISAFVDEHIKMMVPLIPSYVRDTPDFIRKIENFSIPGDVYLVTMDVTSLYTNIPNMEGLVSITPSLMKHQPEFKLQYKTLLELLKLVLHKNNFQFNGEHYLQIGGTAMGTKTAPSYANLFMARLEEKLLEKAKTDLQIELPLYLRYIDDIFFIFPYSETKLEQFMTLISQNDQIYWGTFKKRDHLSWYICQTRQRFTVHRPVRQRDSHTQLSALHIMPSQKLYKKSPIWQFPADQTQLRKKRWLWKTFKGHENALCEPRLPWWNHRGIISKSTQSGPSWTDSRHKNKGRRHKEDPTVPYIQPAQPKLVENHQETLASFTSVARMQRTIPRNTNSGISQKLKPAR